MGQDPAAIREEIEHTRERMGDTVDALGYKADVPSRAKDSISDKVQGVKAKIAGAGSQVSDATPGSEDVKQAGRRAVGVAQENPLGLAIGAAAVGFIAGLLVPSTKVEDERLGPVADQVKEQARQTGQEAIEHGKEIAQRHRPDRGRQGTGSRLRGQGHRPAVRSATRRGPQGQRAGQRRDHQAHRPAIARRSAAQPTP